MTQPIADTFAVIRPVSYETARRTVVVLGAPRGGTSMVSGALACLGVYMGDDIGHQKEDPRFREETPPETKRAAIAANNAAHMVWGWKLPNTIYYYGALHPQLINPVFVSVYRNPFGVARSSARHDGTALTQDLVDVPIRHYTAMHRTIDAHPQVPLAACSFETATRSDRKEQFVDALAAFVGLTPSPAQRAAALDFVDYGKGYQD